MDFLNKTVIHITLGAGIITEHNHPYFKVKFGDKISQFSFPQSFDVFLHFSDEGDQIELEKLIKEENEQKERSYVRTTSSIESASKTLRNITDKMKPKTEKPNIAIKSNFCDGGSNKYHIGFLGACSDKLIQYNSEVARHSWCSDPDSPCYQYLTGKINRWELDEMCKDSGHVCYESQMLREWSAFAGYILTGEKRNEPKKIRNVQVNSLAILTTREPYADEEDRIIFGVFLVDEAEKVVSLARALSARIPNTVWNSHQKNQNRSSFGTTTLMERIQGRLHGRRDCIGILPIQKRHRFCGILLL